MNIAAVTPILGEFGYIVFDIQPRVRAWLRAQHAARKIVFAPRELSPFFEEATEIIEPPAELLPTAPATMRSVCYECWDPAHPERQKIEKLVQWARSMVNADAWLEIPYFDGGQWMAPATFTQLKGRRSVSVPQNPYIVMAARARAFDPWRNWPTEYWDELARRIQSQWQLEIRGIGRPPSTYFPDGVIPQEIDEVDRLDHSLGLLNHAVCSISSNSGPTHLSLMAGCPTFAWVEPNLKRFMEHHTNPLRTPCHFFAAGWRPDVDSVWQELCEWRKALETDGLWNAANKPQPRLSMCMIARDSSATIRAALDSVKPWVDEMIVVDTGSGDNTPSIAEECGAIVHRAPWEDSFSVARNHSIQRANGEWIFWMDSDDTLMESDGRSLRELVLRDHSPSTMGYVLQVHCPAAPSAAMYSTMTVVDHIKLFRNLPAIRFTGRIHEQVLSAIRELGCAVEWTNIAVLHSGSDQTPEGRARKRARDLRLLQLELKESPDSTFALFNLGMTLLDAGQPDQALNALSRSLQLAEKNESHVRKIYALLVQSYSELHRLDTAYWTCIQGVNAFPGDPELLFRKGSIEQARGHLHEAERSFLAALQTNPGQHFSSIDSGIMGAKAWHNLAILYGQQNRHNLAAAAWKKVVEADPDNRMAWRGLLDAFCASRDIPSINDAIAFCQEKKIGTDISALAQAKLLIARSDIYAAVSVLESALTTSNSIDLLDELCQLAFRSDLVDIAERRLIELTRRCPDDASALRNLGIIYLRRKLKSKATECAKRALNLRPDYPAAQELLKLSTAL
jgi:tetratricopeptide (TPR) repeat protein